MLYTWLLSVFSAQGFSCNLMVASFFYKLYFHLFNWFFSARWSALGTPTWCFAHAPEILNLDIIFFFANHRTYFRIHKVLNFVLLRVKTDLSFLYVQFCFRFLRLECLVHFEFRIDLFFLVIALWQVRRFRALEVTSSTHFIEWLFEILPMISTCRSGLLPQLASNPSVAGLWSLWDSTRPTEDLLLPGEVLVCMLLSRLHEHLCLQIYLRSIFTLILTLLIFHQVWISIVWLSCVLLPLHGWMAHNNFRTVPPI